MKTTWKKVCAALGAFVLTAGIVQAQPLINAAIMVSSGESPSCTFGNVSEIYIVSIWTSANPTVRRYVDGRLSRCSVVPIRAALGTTVFISGAIQTAFSAGNAPIVTAPPSPNGDNCFNVEGFSVGLQVNESFGPDPQDPTNIINKKGYGYMYEDVTGTLAEGPSSFTVVGCGGVRCPANVAPYNTDELLQSDCPVLKPIS